MVKKLSELTILCGVEACVVIYPPDSNTQPEVWPLTAATRSLFSEYMTLPANRMNLKDIDERIHALVKAYAYGGKDD
ncbi:hypothetical protein V6N13_140109 [Hibiscus sabdariffa]|uniref:MADS-box domain-containing protein n=1 Tax=Hibiscus sabdariffa TaxID=183260 RepID=A0ABR2QB46_9ROSI